MLRMLLFWQVKSTFLTVCMSDKIVYCAQRGLSYEGHSAAQMADNKALGEHWAACVKPTEREQTISRCTCDSLMCAQYIIRPVWRLERHQHERGGCKWNERKNMQQHSRLADNAGHTNLCCYTYTRWTLRLDIAAVIENAFWITEDVYIILFRFSCLFAQRRLH